MEKKLDNILYINEDLIKEKNELRKKIYERIYERIYILKNNSKFYNNEFYNKEKLLFEDFKLLFEFEDEYVKLTEKYNKLYGLTQSINFYSNEIKKS